MGNIYKKLVLSVTLIATVFLLTGCKTEGLSTNENIDHKDNLAIQSDLQQKIEVLEAQKNDLSFPGWVSKLNLSEPDDMQLDKTKSHQSTKQVEGFDSIHFVYQGDYDTAMQQAKKIAQKSNIPVSPEFKMAQELAESMGSGNEDMQKLFEDMKGIVYTNYNLMGNNKDLQYVIAITVNDDGSLELDATDIVAMEQITKELIE